MSQGLTDFDDLLRRLGAVDAEPPPLMKKLLDDRALAVDTSITADAVLLEQLETWLAIIEEERRARSVS